jgi:hypothetical protein
MQIKFTTFLVAVFLFIPVFMNAQFILCGVDAGEMDLFGDNDIAVYAFYEGVDSPELLEVLSPGESSTVEYFCNSFGNLSHLAFLTICWDGSFAGSTQVCQQLGGAGSLCVATYECQNDFFVWTPPAPTASICESITFNFSHRFLAIPGISYTIDCLLGPIECPDSLVLDQPLIETGEYRGLIVTASGTIAPTADVTIQGEIEVNLDTGFHSPVGTSLLVTTGQCIEIENLVETPNTETANANINELSESLEHNIKDSFGSKPHFSIRLPNCSYQNLVERNIYLSHLLNFELWEKRGSQVSSGWRYWPNMMQEHQYRIYVASIKLVQRPFIIGRRIRLLRKMSNYAVSKNWKKKINALRKCTLI